MGVLITISRREHRLLEHSPAIDTTWISVSPMGYTKFSGVL